ncbi:MAG: sulfur oxidation c-type cytochrome SoxA [Oceanospirillaceae bacterium]|nr:sulfur oxidation c-type cytochrome SoxA [Oceanospirillaceae bacterium]
MKIIKSLLAGASIALVASITQAATSGNTLASVDPEADRLALQSFFQKRFPQVPVDDYVNGIYALDSGSRAQWEEIEEFPPYEFDVEEGEVLFNTPFANGKSYADCFANEGVGIRQNFPRWDDSQGKIVTLESAINQCREANGEKKLGWKKGKIAQISAYMAYTSRGNVFDVKIPNDGAKAAYLDGKQSFYTRRGQLNMSCANCHVAGSNVLIRADLPGPALGHVTHFPVFRSKWGNLGTLQRRYAGCQSNVRGVSQKAQGEKLSNLEFFQTYMSNGLEVNGPGARK